MQMLRFLFLCALTAMAAACSKAVDYDVPPRQAPALWMVEDADSGARGYIMGSVHMLPDGLDWTSSYIRTAAADSDLLITEIGSNFVQAGLFDVMASDEPVSPMDRRLDASGLARAEIFASGSGITEDELDTKESWAVAIILTRAQSADLGVTTEFGVEAQLRELMAGKPVIGLETAQTQLERFDALPNAAQDTMLRLSLRPTDPRADFQAMVTAWLTGDLATLEADMADGIMADKRLRVALLDEPNAAWAGQIATHIRAKKRPFIAIGTAHLLGEQSVLALLSAQGMTVSRVQ